MLNKNIQILNKKYIYIYIYVYEIKYNLIR